MMPETDVPRRMREPDTTRWLMAHAGAIHCQGAWASKPLGDLAAELLEERESYQAFAESPTPTAGQHTFNWRAIGQQLTSLAGEAHIGSRSTTPPWSARLCPRPPMSST